MGQARLGDWQFSVDPSEITWGISANLADAKGLGGKVVQVLSVHYTDMTVKVAFTTWEEQWDFVLYMKAALREDLAEDSPKHFRFLYPPRSLDMTVAVMRIAQGSRSIQWNPGTPVQPCTLTLKIIGDAKGVTTRMNHELIDEYINRFAQDFGWKRTPYNGPINAQDVLEYTSGINQRIPTTATDGWMANAVQQGTSTPAIPTPTQPSRFQ